MNKILLIFLLYLLTYPRFAEAQVFTDLHSNLPTLAGASVAWADYDNDGDLDFALIGFSSQSAEEGFIYRNDGNGIFTVIDTIAFPVAFGAVSWGDYDHDGDPDLLVNGQNGGSGPVASTTLYRNDGNDIFTVAPSNLPGNIGVARWIDYDGDGWPDIIMCGTGITLTGDSTRLLHNDTNGTFTEIPSNLPGYFASDISIVDFDNDGDMDFFLTGGTLSSSTFPVSALFRNDGNGIFTIVPYNFRNLSTGTSAWADIDNDGDKDLLYDGIDSTAGFGITLIYRNDSAGNFTMINDSLPGSGEPGSVDWADIDNDGDLDILLGGPTTLLRNDGNNHYTDITPFNFPQGVPNSFADIDNDGDPDILIISASGGFSGSTIFRNENITSINDIDYKNNFTVYPNPASTELHIHSDKIISGEIEFRLLNIFGEKIFCKSLNGFFNNEMRLDVSQLKPSMYFYNFCRNGYVIYSGKIIVE